MEWGWDITREPDSYPQGESAEGGQCAACRLTFYGIDYSVIVVPVTSGNAFVRQRNDARLV
jgi:hypothetical protein